MKFKFKPIYLIGAAILFIAMKKPKKNQFKSPDEELKHALDIFLSKYGRENAISCEQLIRLETGHFKSKQWTNCNAAGMETFSPSFPFGWSSLKDFCNKYNYSSSDFGKWSAPEGGTGIVKTFIVFPSISSFVEFLGYLMEKRDWNWGSWYSLNSAKQDKYEQTLTTITPKIINSIT